MSSTENQERISDLDFRIATARLTVKKGRQICPRCPELAPEERCGPACPVVVAFLIADMEREKQLLQGKQ